MQKNSNATLLMLLLWCNEIRDEYIEMKHDYKIYKLKHA